MELKLEVEVGVMVVLLELVEVGEGLIIHIGRAGRRDNNQQQAIPNLIFW